MSGDVEDTAHDSFADRYLDGLAAVGDRQATLESFGARHRYRAHPPVAEMLLHFERDGL
jgi:hypothetical protein